MKRLLLILSLALLVTASACGSAQEAEEPEAQTEAAQATEEAEPAAQAPAAGGETLVVYFSRVGNTDFPADVDAVSSASVVRTEDGIAGNAQLMAQWVAEETGGTLFEIRTAEKYPIDYTETTNVAKEEQNENARPALAAEIEDFDSYSTVCLVFPNWWGDLPMALYSFFEAYDFTGKTLYVSVTHGGSGFSRTVSTIEELAPGALVAEGLSVRDSDVPGAEASVREWARETVAS